MKKIIFCLIILSVSSHMSAAGKSKKVVSDAGKKVALKILFAEKFHRVHLNLGVSSTLSLHKLAQEIESVTGAKKKRNQISASDIVFKDFDASSTIDSLLKSNSITKDEDSNRFVLFAEKN